MIALLPLVWRVGLIAAAVAALIVGYGVWHHKVYQKGYDAAIADVAAENKEAVDAAKALQDKRHACIAAGGSWSVVDGVCNHP